MVLSPSVVRLMRFGAVGVLNTAFGYAVYAALVHVGTVPEIALLAATIMGVVFNFFTTGRVVFRNSNNRLFVRFLAVYAVAYLLNAVVLRGLVTLGIGPLFTQAVLMPVTIVTVFMAMSAFVFREARE